MAATLLQGNAAWATSAPPELLASLSKGQAPKVFWIGCSDSRVPEGSVTGAQPGDCFVVRNIAAQVSPVDDTTLAALTYAIQGLSVEHIVIVGHTSCGGVHAACVAASSSDTESGVDNSPLSRYLSPLSNLARKIRREHPEVDEHRWSQLVTEASVADQVANVAASPVVQANWRGVPSPITGKVTPKVTVHGWVYDLPSGKINDLKVDRFPNTA